MSRWQKVRLVVIKHDLTMNGCKSIVDAQEVILDLTTNGLFNQASQFWLDSYLARYPCKPNVSYSFMLQRLGNV